MRKIIPLLLFAIFLTSVVSAEIIIQQQPDELYNLGEEISVPVILKASGDTRGSLDTELLCQGFDSKIIPQGQVSLKPENSYQETKTLIVFLERDVIGNRKGSCEIRISFKDEVKLTSKFSVSDFIKIEFPIEKTEFKPGESVLIKGTATRESQKLVDGYIEVSIGNGDKTITLEGLVNEGYFSINFSIPKTMPAGQYLTKIKVYEKTDDETINSGFMDYNILVQQIPTNLEIMFEQAEIDPGANLKVKAILHDQSGASIDSVSIITIKDENNKILEQLEKSTGEFLEYSIMQNQPPAEWRVFAVSNQLTSEATFKIKEKKDVHTELMNRTLLITNIGNVPYNDILSIKIGNEFLELNLSLGIGEMQKFVLSAPNGEYKVEIMSSAGEKKISTNVVLTGNSINVKKATEGMVTFIRHPLVWIFIIAILGFVAFIFYKKGYQRSFFGYIQKMKSKKKENSPQILMQKSLITDSKSKAELSLSIKGEKQPTSIVCVHVKNLKEIESQKDGAKSVLQEIIDIAENNKASTYENQDNLFFILAPVTTKTFKNEKNALKIAQEIQEHLKEHNRLAKQKVNFGISLNYGAIVAKKEGGILKFMSMGTLVTGAKRISSLADKEILLGEKIKEKLMAEVKTEKQIRNNVAVYAIKEIKRGKEENEKFINSFVRRMEGKK